MSGNIGELEKKIDVQAQKVTAAKASGAGKDEVGALVADLLALKEQLPDGHPSKPVPKDKKKKKSAAAPAAEAPKPAAKKQKEFPQKKEKAAAAPAPAKAEKKTVAPVEAPVGAVVFGKGISDAVKMKVLVAAVAAKQSPVMIEDGSSPEPAVKTAAGPVSGTNAVCKYFAEQEAGTPLLGAEVDQWLQFDAQLAGALAADPVAALQKVEQQLKKNGGFLVGKQVSLADIVVWCTVYSAFGVQDDLPSEVRLGLPAVCTWLQQAAAACSALSLMLSVAAAPRAAKKKKRTAQRFGDTFYITTAINYINGVPHMGHCYEAVGTDVQARYHRIFGREVFFLTGTDEHGQKIADSAVTKGFKSPQEMVDMYVTDHFKPLNAKLNISSDRYVRTTDADHLLTAQKVWELAEANGDIYLGQYTGWYNVKEEAFVTDAEAEANEFKDAAGNPLQKKDEASYFFRMSKYHDWLVKHFQDHPEFLMPSSRYNEIMARLTSDRLRDLSSSRNTFDWGVPILTKEGKETKHVMYVWFDALTNYLTGVGYCPGSHGPHAKFWPPQCHVIGKDISWFHTVIWPCMLQSAGIPLPRTIFAHGFVKGTDGRTMSKSLGNVVDPVELLKPVEEGGGGYSSDTLRYFLCREATWGADLTFMPAGMEERHNTELADTLGNLVHRATNLCNKYDGGLVADCETDVIFDLTELTEDSEDAFAEFRIADACEAAVQALRDTNKYITDKEPWKMKDDVPGRTRVVKSTLEAVYVVAHFLSPYIPDATGKIFERLNAPARTIKELSPGFNNLKVGTKITVGEILFAKFEKKDKEAKPVPVPKAKPGKAPKAVPSAAPSAAPAPAASGGDLGALEAAITAQGLKVREVKTAGADKAAIEAEVAALLKLKADFAAAGGVLPDAKSSKKKKK